MPVQDLSTAAGNPPAVTFRASEVPTGDKVIFENSSFFIRNKRPLPTPSEVREQSEIQRRTTIYKPHVVHFRDLGLVVKYNKWGRVTIAEGQCLWAIKHFLQEGVPVPEVYGWCRDDDEDFVYIALVEGDTLETRWPSLSTTERWEISKQLRGMLENLASLKQEEPFVGSLTGQPLQDIIWAHLEPKSGKGPFSSVKDFNDWYAYLISERFEGSEGFVDPSRHKLLDNVTINFTHGDLHPSNIMVSPASAAKLEIRAIIDWHQSGWYPAYWESCKIRWSVEYDGEWRDVYLPKILDEPAGDCYEGWFYFLHCLGV